jgi:hypothetical protein
MCALATMYICSIALGPDEEAAAQVIESKSCSILARNLMMGEIRESLGLNSYPHLLC